MANHTGPDDNSAFLGGALVLFAFILRFALPDPYNDIAGKVLIGIIILVIVVFFAATIIDDKK